MKKTIILVLFLIKFSFSEPLYDSSGRFFSLFSDHRAFRIGDIITINVSESLKTSDKDSFKTDKEYKITGADGTGLLKFIPNLGGSGKSSSKTDRSKAQSKTLLITLSGRITEIYPNGDLKIEGSREILVEGEKTNIVFSGIVRPDDIERDNTVLSSKIADFKIDSESKGRKPGIITRILRFFF